MWKDPVGRGWVRVFPLNVAGKGGLGSLGAGVTGVTGSWRCGFALGLCVVCSPDWFVFNVGGCCQFGVSCLSCAWS